MRSDLAARYGEARLPRYTSYPTAAQFSAMVSQNTYDEWLGSLPAGGTASLYLHIPFCRSMCWYCGCHTSITSRQGPIADYLAVLSREIDLVAGRIACPLPVYHVHFGGGTPTIMQPEAFLQLVGHLRERFPFAASVEIAVEADPRTLTPVMIAALGEAGVTRASLGVQSFDLFVQKAINRVQSFEETAAATEALRRAGVTQVNFDLIYGLPHQTTASCIDTIERCLTLRPDRFSVFGYAHVPGFKKHQRKIEETALPDSHARYAQAETIAEALLAAGYRRIGLDHYALPEDPMAKAQAAGTLHRNFQGYTTDASDILIGFGASAIGRFPEGYVQNDVVLKRYVERINGGGFATARGLALTADDRLRAELIERLMCDFEVDVDEICRRHGRAPDAFLRSLSRLEALIADGIIQLEEYRLSVAENTRFLVRCAASVFDAYLDASGRLHSRAV